MVFYLLTNCFDCLHEKNTIDRNNEDIKIKEKRLEQQRVYKNSYAKRNKHQMIWRRILHRVLEQFGTKKEGHI